MKIDGAGNKPIVLSTLAISMFYNLFWVIVFYYIMTLVDTYLHLLTISFLLFYLLVAQPLRDIIINNILLKALHPDMKSENETEESLLSLQTKEDIFRHFQKYLKAVEISSVFLIIVDNPEMSVFITKNKIIDQLDDQYINTPSLLQYLEYRHEAMYYENLPDNLQETARSNSWITIVPILFRSRVRALAAFPEKLEKRAVQEFSPIFSRAGLILENESLTLNVLKNRVFQKEFDMARQVEKFLIPEPIFKAGAFTFRNLYEFEKEYRFPLLFDSAAGQGSGAITFVIICKISDTSRRSKSIQLFSVQGYFLSYARRAKNLTQLVKWMYQSLVKSSGGLYLQGYLIEISDKGNWKGVHFGRDLAIHLDGTLIELPYHPPLGSQAKGTVKPLPKRKCNSIHYSIKNLHVAEAINSNDK